MELRAGDKKVEGEEGSTGLVNAFLFDGARTVAASPWPGEDASTELLMKQFYTRLAQKEDQASALRRAKLAKLSNRPLHASRQMVRAKEPRRWAWLVPYCFAAVTSHTWLVFEKSERFGTGEDLF